MPFIPERGAPTPPIELPDAASATARLTGAQFAMTDALLGRLADACSAVSTDSAACCIGREPPPSRNDPALASDSMTLLGPTVQLTRQPG